MQSILTRVLRRLQAIVLLYSFEVSLLRDLMGSLGPVICPDFEGSDLIDTRLKSLGVQAGSCNLIGEETVNSKSSVRSSLQVSVILMSIG